MLTVDLVFALYSFFMSHLLFKEVYKYTNPCLYKRVLMTEDDFQLLKGNIVYVYWLTCCYEVANIPESGVWRVGKNSWVFITLTAAHHLS